VSFQQAQGTFATGVGTVRVCKLRSYGADLIGLVLPDGEIRPIPSVRTVGAALQAFVSGQLRLEHTLDPLRHIEVLAPVDRKRLWGADAIVPSGESRGAYRPRPVRPETARRIVGPFDELVMLRAEAWTAPSFELAIWLDASLAPIGLGLANGLCVREATSENAARASETPRRIQSVVRREALAIGPAVLPMRDLTAVDAVVLECSVDRDGTELWSERVELSGAARVVERVVARVQEERHEDLSADGLILLTGVGCDTLGGRSLVDGDVVTASAERLGVLANRVRVGR
jgi:hypothetical protein